MNKPKVTGFLNYEVKVKCPHCNGRLDLNQSPYPEDDDESYLGLAIFGRVDEPAKWDDINLEYQCNHCKKEFILEKVEY